MTRSNDPNLRLLNKSCTKDDGERTSDFADRWNESFFWRRISREHSMSVRDPREAASRRWRFWRVVDNTKKLRDAGVDDSCDKRLYYGYQRHWFQTILNALSSRTGVGKLFRSRAAQCVLGSIAGRIYLNQVKIRGSYMYFYRGCRSIWA